MYPTLHQALCQLPRLRPAAPPALWPKRGAYGLVAKVFLAASQRT